MNEFFLAAAAFIVFTVAVGLVRVLRGPADVDRMMAAQLFATGGIASLLLVAHATAVPGVEDVALGLARRDARGGGATAATRFHFCGGHCWNPCFRRLGGRLSL